MFGIMDPQGTQNTKDTWESPGVHKWSGQVSEKHGQG